MNSVMSLVSLFLCFVFIFIILKFRFFYFHEESDGRYLNLDSLRGGLSVCVFFHHFVITYYWKLNGVWSPPPEYYYNNCGVVSVSMFFMLTSFLFTSKIIKKSHGFMWLEFFESRFFRIFPLYFFVVLCVFFIVLLNNGFSLKVSIESFVKEIILWVIFRGGAVNGFVDAKTIIAGVDWTLQYEWLFYFCLPVIYVFLVRLKYFFPVFMFVMALIFFVFPFNFTIYPFYEFRSQYVSFFAVGCLISYCIENFKFLRVGRWAGIDSILVILLFFVCFLYKNTLDFYHFFFISFLFYFLASGVDIFGLLVSRPARMLGRVSYSVYLIHGIILYCLFTQFSFFDVRVLGSDYILLMPITSVVVIFFSIITYYFIEKNGISFGRKFIFSSTIRRLGSKFFT